MQKEKCPYLKGRYCDNKQNGSKLCKYKDFKDCKYYNGSKLHKEKIMIGKNKTIKVSIGNGAKLKFPLQPKGL